MDIHRFYGALMRGFRIRRMQRFAAQFAPGRDTCIHDVGGSAINLELAGIRARITLVNLMQPRHPPAEPERFASVIGSGTALPVRPGAFDIAFSNSVIEHVGSFEDQRRFAEQVRQAARSLWIQTPARSFPVEVHLLTPLIHYLPRRLQAPLVRNFTVWGWLSRPAPEVARSFVERTRLLSFREMQRLFPDCEIRRERFLGLTKAFVAVRVAPGSGRPGTGPRGDATSARSMPELGPDWAPSGRPGRAPMGLR
jgi:hypothetical protein